MHNWVHLSMHLCALHGRYFHISNRLSSIAKVIVLSVFFKSILCKLHNGEKNVHFVQFVPLGCLQCCFFTQTCSKNLTLIKYLYFPNLYRIRSKFSVQCLWYIYPLVKYIR
jgi:hypothetical protein